MPGHSEPARDPGEAPQEGRLAPRGRGRLQPDRVPAAGAPAWSWPPTSPRRSGWRSSSCRPRRWRRWAGWPAASPTTSTTCWASSPATASCCSRTSARSTRARKRVEQIQKAAERAAGLTRQLLAFSRKQVLEPQVLDLNAVVADMEKMLAPPDRRGHRAGDDAGRRARPHPGRPGADRAGDHEPGGQRPRRHAARAGGCVIETAERRRSTRATRARTRRSSPGRYVMLAVSDTGAGMDARDPGAHLRALLHHQGGGQGHRAGPGHRVRDRQAERRQHQRRQRARPGHHVPDLLPAGRGRGRRAAPRSRAGVPGPRGTETILLVEDEEPLRVMIREILEGAGYTVLEAADPEEALPRSSTLDAPIHLLLTDVVMPRMSGPELARSVRADAARAQGALHVRLHRRRHRPSRGAGRGHPLAREALHRAGAPGACGHGARAHGRGGNA